MKKYTILLSLVLFAVMIGTIAALIDKSYKYSNEIDRLNDNLSEYGDSISNLSLTEAEIRREIEKGNKEIARMDSVLKSKNIKINQLENYISTTIVISDPDTTFLTIEKSVPVYLVPETAKYKSNFSEKKECISISGFVISTDPSPQVAITNRSVEVIVEEINYNRKWFQFWKPKNIQKVSSNCGSVKILKITN